MKNIGLIRHDSDHTSEKEQEHLNIKSGDHALIVGATGSGKTMLLKQLMDMKINSGDGENIVLIDEKDILHLDCKQMFQDEHDIYQLSPGGVGSTNNVQINLISLVCTSDKKAIQFFKSIISDDYEKDDGNGHRFWAIAGAELAFKVYKYIHTMNSLLQLLEQHNRKEYQ